MMYLLIKMKITSRHFNLKTVVGHEKAVQAIDVLRNFKKCVVTFWVMSQFLKFLGTSRGCTDFRDPTAVFRFNQLRKTKRVGN